MKKIIRNVFRAAALLAVLSLPTLAQTVKRAAFDVTGYVMDVFLVPTDRKINATVDVSFTPLEDTRSVSFELNGSLKVDSVSRVNGMAALPAAPARKTPPKTVPTPATPQNAITFVQDQTNSTDLGPHVRIEFADMVTKGTPVVLRFKYSGILDSPAGGPLLSKRLAYIGDNYGYLMYAARWFPFHDYAADVATADVNISIPAGFQVVGYSDGPVASTGGRYHFIQSSPALPGNFAYGKFDPRTLRVADQEVQFYAKPGNYERFAAYGETLGKALDYYTKRFGPSDSGKRLAVVEIDDESLDFYSSRGILFIAQRPFEEARDVTFDRLQREAA